jgi:hypothetical protein
MLGTVDLSFWLAAQPQLNFMKKLVDIEFQMLMLQVCGMVAI